MASNWTTQVTEFKGGLVSSLSPLQQGINAVGSAVTLQNFEPSLSGGYKKVLGYEKFSDVEVTGTGEIQGVCVTNEVDSNVVIVIRDGVYYQGNGTSWTSKATASTTSFDQARFTKYNFNGTPKIAFVDGSNYPAYYDSSADTVTFLTTSTENDQVQGAEHVAFFKNSLFFAKGSDLFFTSPFTDTDLLVANGAGQINVGSDVTGLIVFREQLIIFSIDRITRLVGSTVADYSLQPIVESIGCIESGTIQEIGGDIMFMGPDGLRTLSATDRVGDFGLDVASKPIKENYNVFKANSTAYSSLVIRNKAQYRIFGYTSADRSAISRGIIGTKYVDQGGVGMQFSEIKGIKVKVCDSQLTGQDELIVFANDDGYVYKMEVGNSWDGSNIDAIYESPSMPFQDPQVRKTFYKFTLYLDPEGLIQLTANLLFDQNDPNIIQPPAFTITGTGTGIFTYGSPTAVFGTATFGGTLDKKFGNNVIGSGKSVAVRIQDISTNPSFTLDTAIFEYGTDDRQ